MIQELLLSLENRTNLQRDLIVDNLCDIIDYHPVTKEQKEEIVTAIMKLFDNESDSATRESMFNLLSSAQAFDISKESISCFTLDLLPKLEYQCLVHALPIIATSQIINRRELIQKYINSEDTSIKEVALSASELLID
jgi:hypothetical protein